MQLNITMRATAIALSSCSVLLATVYFGMSFFISPAQVAQPPLISADREEFAAKPESQNTPQSNPNKKDAIEQTSSEQTALDRASQRTALTVFLDGFDESKPRKRRNLNRALFATVGVDEQSQHAFSQELVNAFSSTVNGAKREALIDLMVTIPNQASLELGRRLIDSNAEQDIIDGLRLLATRDSDEQIANSELIHIAWSGPKNIATAALDAARVDLLQEGEKPVVAAGLSELIDTHTSGDVKAIALHKLIELGENADSIQRLEDSLDSTYQDLSLTAANLIVTLDVQTPGIRAAAAKILQNPSRSALLNASAAQILLGYGDLTP